MPTTSSNRCWSRFPPRTKAGPCVTYIGPGGAGHYVKMVHNGIEYGDMQLIAETYDIMRRALGMSAAEIGIEFEHWNKGKLESFLVEITGQVLAITDADDGIALVDHILDTAEQKGTGRWTSQNALDLGTPIPTIDAAVLARSMSSRKEEREAASQELTGPRSSRSLDQAERQAHDRPSRKRALLRQDLVVCAGNGVLAGGLRHIQLGSRSGRDRPHLEAGCIIRAELLDPIRTAFKDDPALVNLLLAPHITKDVNENGPSARVAVVTAVRNGIPAPAYTASLNYVDTYRTEKLPANLIQGLRDNFGAHTYRRLDTPGVFHTNWTTGATETIG